MKRVFCWLFGHRYEVVWRYKKWGAWSTGAANQSNKHFKIIERGKWKAKYCYCSRCHKRITLPEAEDMGIYHPYRRPHFQNL